jgi:ribonuclease HII
VSLKPTKPPPKCELRRLEKLTELETAARAKGYRCIAGVDEAGRGPLAGPVVAAACSIPQGLYFPGINDSKLLLPKKRKTLFEQITGHKKVHYGVGIVEHSVIDRINILQAALEAMRSAVKQLPVQPDCLLVDGAHCFTESIYSEPVIKGDSRSQMIAAASIIAKEMRDRIMVEYHKRYPEYGFDEHKGYPTEKHRKALAKYGPCPIHRLTFSSVSQLTLSD